MNIEYNFINWLWTLLISVFFFMCAVGAAIYFWWQWKIAYNVDLIMMIDKNNRYQLVKMSAIEFEYKDGKYFKEDAKGLLNKKGKSFHVFSHGNPVPMDIKYKKSSWLDAETLKTTLNNKLIKLMVAPQEKFDEILVRLGAIGGIVAGLTGAIMLANQMGLINI